MSVTLRSIKNYISLGKFYHAVKSAVVILVIVLFAQDAIGACGCGICDCSSQEELEFCGSKHHHYGTCHTIVGGDKCDQIISLECVCDDSNKVPSIDLGCICKEGMYGPPDSYMSCSNCPSGGTSSTGNNATIDDCYTQGNMYDAASHGTVNKLCYWDGSSYANCINYYVVSCDAGYYRASTADTFCTAVGDRYYSPSNPNTDSLKRYACPDYTNPSGGQTQGYTAGSGAAAAAVTNCFIPTSEKYTDSVGTYSYNICYYSL